MNINIKTKARYFKKELSSVSSSFPLYRESTKNLSFKKTVRIKSDELKIFDFVPSLLFSQYFFVDV